MSTADLVHQSVIEKFDHLIRLCELLQADDASIQDLYASYTLGTVSILARTDDSSIQREQALAIYRGITQYITNSNVVSNMDIAFRGLSLRYKLQRRKSKEVENLLDAYASVSIQTAITSVDFTTCECGGVMGVESDISSLVCKRCGLIQKLHGVVFDSAMSRTHTNYDSTKHGKAWMDKIQAREDTDVTEVAAAVLECARNDRIIATNLSCELIRIYLKRVKMTKYNDHVPAIRKHITGISPPQFTESEQKKINMYFDRAIHIFNKLKSGEKPNAPYHPYFLYKIIEQVVTTDKRAEILSCIHLQSPVTLCRHDLLWKLICAEIPEFKYMPTVK